MYLQFKDLAKQVENGFLGLLWGTHSLREIFIIMLLLFMLVSNSLLFDKDISDFTNPIYFDLHYE